MVKYTGDNKRNIRIRFLKLFVILALVLVYNWCSAASYYFSSISGDDSRSALQAQNPATPWKTLSNLNSFFSKLKPGDSVLFKRNEMFYGSIRITASGSMNNPIVVSAYGAGAKPIITSLISLTKWTSVGNGIYETTDDLLGSSVNVLLLNKAVKEIGRYPNSNDVNGGYLTISSHSGNTSITDEKTPFTKNWKGAEVVIRKNNWTLDRHLITNQAGNTINYAPGSEFSYNNPTDKYGYFIQNDIKALDEAGEWCYSADKKKLNIYLGNRLPETSTIEVSTIDHLVSASKPDGNNANVTFSNLCFRGANRNAFLLNWGSYYTIENCDIEFSGQDGIKAVDVSYLTVENNRISKSNNAGIFSGNNNIYSVIKNNIVDSTFLFKGMGNDDNGTGLGIYSISDNSKIENNQVLNTGYSGIVFSGDFVLVKNNFVKNYCLSKDDGGGIYCFNASSKKNSIDRKIIGNIVLNGIGAKHGTIYNFGQAIGIYLDDNSSDVIVSDNSVANASSYGMFLHNTKKISVSNNTLFDNVTQYGMGHDKYGDPITNVNITNNIFFSRYANQPVSAILSINNDAYNMAQSDNNYYARPFNQDTIINIQQSIQSPSFTYNQHDLSSWINASHQDALSKKAPFTYPQYLLNDLVGSNKFTNGNFENSTSGVVFYATAGGGSYTWDNSNKLSSGGSVKLVNPGLSFAIMATGSVDATKHYVLRFKALSDQGADVKVYLRQYNSPYANISKSYTFKVNSTLTEYEYLFSFPKAESSSSIVFESNNTNLTYWLDDINLSEVNVSYINPNDYIVYEYNASNSNKTIQLYTNYVDVKNVPYSGSVVLKPYSSIVLMKSICSAPGKPVVAISNP